MSNRIRAGIAFLAALKARGESIEDVRAALMANIEASRGQFQSAIDGHRLAGDELEALGLHRVEDDEDLEHLARVIEIPEQEIGALTYRQIFLRVMAWADRERVKGKLWVEAASLLKNADGSEPPGSGRQASHYVLVSKAIAEAHAAGWKVAGSTISDACKKGRITNRAFQGDGKGQREVEIGSFRSFVHANCKQNPAR